LNDPKPAWEERELDPSTNAIVVPIAGLADWTPAFLARFNIDADHVPEELGCIRLTELRGEPAIAIADAEAGTEAKLKGWLEFLVWKAAGARQRVALAR
jgi:hypothetical protein